MLTNRIQSSFLKRRSLPLLKRPQQKNQSRSFFTKEELEYDIALESTKKPLTEDLINIREVNKGLVFTLNRPKALNSVNQDMVSTLLKEYSRIVKHSKTDKIILTSAGQKAFCAGGDVKELYGEGKAVKKDRATFFQREYTLNHLISTLKIPHVAVINGITFGGGAGLSVHGNIRIATEDTVFAMPEAAIGFFCDVGGSYFLPRLSNKLGYYLGITGASLRGIDVKKAGLATHFVMKECLQDVMYLLASTPVTTVEDMNELIKPYEKVSLERFDKPGVVDQYGELINEIFSMEKIEDMVKALDHVGIDFSKDALKNMEKNSPLSMKVIHESLKRGSTKDLAKCLEMEFDMTQNFMEGEEFYTGVGALKNKTLSTVKWNPQRLEDVTQEMVDNHFQKASTVPEGFLKLTK